MSIEVRLEKVTKLIESGRYQQLPKGHIIQSSETKQFLFRIKSGYIKRYMITNEGSLSIQAIYGPGYIFPLTYVYKTLFGQSLYTGPEVIYYECMTDTELFSIGGFTLVEACRSDESLYKELLSVAGRRFYSNIQQLENIGLKDAYHRVAHQLLYFAREFGEVTSAGTVIKLPLTHQDIADVLSTTRETVSLCMGDLRKKRLIKTGKRITVPDMKKLHKEAYS